MKTDDLIDILSAEVDAVDPQRVKRIVLAFVSAALSCSCRRSISSRIFDDDFLMGGPAPHALFAKSQS